MQVKKVCHFNNVLHVNHDNISFYVMTTAWELEVI